VGSDRQRTEDHLDVGISRVLLPTSVGTRAREWALALAHDAESRGHPEAAEELASPRVCLFLQGIIDETRLEFAVLVEKSFLSYGKKRPEEGRE
jgi:hypothetical protein